MQVTDPVGEQRRLVSLVRAHELSLARGRITLDQLAITFDSMPEKGLRQMASLSTDPDFRQLAQDTIDRRFPFKPVPF